MSRSPLGLPSISPKHSSVRAWVRGRTLATLRRAGARAGSGSLLRSGRITKSPCSAGCSLSRAAPRELLRDAQDRAPAPPRVAESGAGADGGSLQARDHPLAQALRRPRALPLPASPPARLTTDSGIGTTQPRPPRQRSEHLPPVVCPIEARTTSTGEEPAALSGRSGSPPERVTDDAPSASRLAPGPRAEDARRSCALPVDLLPDGPAQRPGRLPRGRRHHRRRGHLRPGAPGARSDGLLRGGALTSGSGTA